MPFSKFRPVFFCSSPFGLAALLSYSFFVRSIVRDCLFNIFASNRHGGRPFFNPQPEDAPDGFELPTGCGFEDQVAKAGESNDKIVQVYAPTASAEDDELERFYEEIEMALKLKSRYTTVQGDFNAVVGSRLDDTEHPVGRFGAGVRNERGNRLIEFAEQHKFSIMNTFFEEKSQAFLDMEEPGHENFKTD
ncbi:hypothetical protein V3C99_017989 [Haemonchus contortus]|uniref:Craniofacial development protein 2-like n=1 Tax=Haemonchus contortus TaxID=6289 RepID=A0A7I4Z214_HAECO